MHLESSFLSLKRDEEIVPFLPLTMLCLNMMARTAQDILG